MTKNSVIENIKTIFKSIKEECVSKDKNRIIKCLGNILIILVVAIIIKIPFIFINTMLLDFFNSMGFSVQTQNIIGFVVELIYIMVSLLYVYKRLKKLYIDKN